MVGSLQDYIALGKEFVPANKKQSLWDQFFTGVSSSYQNLSQQAQDVSSYDISQAYSNYKQQQLQLKMNEQLGAGFKEETGAQLESDYATAYKNLKTEEATNLYEIETQKKAAIAEKEKEFSELGKQLQTYDKLISEYAKLVGMTMPKNAVTTKRDEYGVTTQELTDYGRLWYDAVLNAKSEKYGTFDEWVLSEDSLSAIDYEDRIALWDAYKSDPELFRQQVAGLSKDFDRAAVTKKVEQEEYDAAKTKFLSVVNTDYWSDNRLGDLSTKQLTQLTTDMNRSSNIISTATKKSTTNAIADSESKSQLFYDEYGNAWKTKRGDSTVIKNSNYKVGDIIQINGKYAVVHGFYSRNSVANIHYIEPSRGKQGVRPGQVSALLPGY